VAIDPADCNGDIAEVLSAGAEVICDAVFTELSAEDAEVGAVLGAGLGRAFALFEVAGG
jgi:hypothetical protein